MEIPHSNKKFYLLYDPYSENYAITNLKGATAKRYIWNACNFIRQNTVVWRLLLVYS